jgi:hypothetical protein
MWRTTRVAIGPDSGPLLRTLLRLRHDLVMIGRAAVVPLPESLKARLEGRINRVTETAADYLRASGAALMTRRGPPPLDTFEAALNAYSAEVAVVRREGLTRFEQRCG